MKKHCASPNAGFLMINHSINGQFRDETDLNNAKFHSQVSIGLVKRILKDKKIKNKRLWRCLDNLEKEIDLFRGKKKDVK